jgi:hypothetical protein
MDVNLKGAPKEIRSFCISGPFCFAQNHGGGDPRGEAFLKAGRRADIAFQAASRREKNR